MWATKASRRSPPCDRRPIRRATMERSPSAPTVNRARMARRSPVASRTSAPATLPPSYNSSSTAVRSSTDAPARRAAPSSSLSSSRRETDNPWGRNGACPARSNTPCSRAPFAPVTVVPRGAAAPAASIVESTPSRSSRRTVSGLMYSEHALSLGNAARSTTATETPARASSVATPVPAGPAPTTRTSVSCNRSVKQPPPYPGEYRGTHCRKAVYHVVVEPCLPSDQLGLRSTAMSSPFTGRVTPRAMEAALECATDKGVHQHSCETYQCSRDRESGSAGRSGSYHGHQCGPEQCPDRSHGADAATGARDHPATAPEQARRYRTQSTGGGGPGIGCFPRENRRYQPHIG